MIIQTFQAKIGVVNQGKNACHVLMNWNLGVLTVAGGK